MGVMGAHAVMGAVSGAMGGSKDEGGAAPQGGGDYQGQDQGQQQYTNPCQWELEQFMQCANGQSDLSLCMAFNDQLKDCKLRNGAI